MPRSQNRPRLGRGLSSLITRSTDFEAGEYQPVGDSGSAPPATVTRGESKGLDLVTLPLDAIAPNPYQPRRTFDEESLQELTESIRAHGMLQPVLVAPAPAGPDATGYQLIAGQRRFLAAQRAGAAELPCIVRTSSPQDMLELALIENIHRANLNPIERAGAYRDLMDRFGLTQQQVAERVGEARATVANYLRMHDLRDDVQSMLTEGRLGFGHAKVLAGLAGAGEVQAALARRVAAEGLSVRQLEQLVKAVQQGGESVGHKGGQALKSRPPYIEDVERQLTEAVGARVSIRPGRARHSGKIVIEYHSLDDFDRVVALLGAEIDS